MTEHKYRNLWKRLLPEIKEKLIHCEKHQDPQEIQLDERTFDQVGERPKSGYGFNIKYSKGIPGPIRESTGKLRSAVSRDLNSEIQKDPGVLAILKRGEFKISMGKSFILKIQRM